MTKASAASKAVQVNRARAGVVAVPRRVSKDSYHHENLRGALLVVARRELEAVGAAELSLRSIARLAGVSSAAPAYHFRNKEGLLVEIAIQGFAELVRNRLAAVRSGESPRENAKQMLSAYVDFALANPGVFDLMFGMRILDRRHHPALRDTASSSFRIFYDTVSAFARSCGWPPDTKAGLVHAAWAVEHGLATLLLSGNAPARSAPVRPDALVTLAIELFLRSVDDGPLSCPSKSDLGREGSAKPL